VSTSSGDAARGPLPGYIGRYRVIDRVGRGAMGVVYAALRQRFPSFQRYADPDALLEPLDRPVAQAALEILQELHNAEEAAYAAMRDGAQDALRPSAPARPSQALALPGGRPVARNYEQPVVDRPLAAEKLWVGTIQPQP
jgi:hypothetical protein